MKMGNRKLKRLDALAVKTINKAPIREQPRNRAERRAKARAERQKT